MGESDMIPIGNSARNRIIGVGSGAEEIINKLKPLEADINKDDHFKTVWLSVEAVNSPNEITVTDDNQMVFIVFNNNADTANLIAKSFHQAKVLTLGFSEDANADPSCFDGILRGVEPTHYFEVIMTLFKIVNNQCFVCLDFNDLAALLYDSGYFYFKMATGESISQAIDNMHEELKNVDMQKIKGMLFNLFLNRETLLPADIEDIRRIEKMIETIPVDVDVIWSAQQDNELNANQIRLVSIMRPINNF